MRLHPTRRRVEIDRAIQRNLKGFGYLGSPDPAVGQTPRTVLHRRGTLSLCHYKPMEKEVYRVPILFVMATTNKAFIFDLAPGQSLIEFLLKRGHDMFSRQTGLRVDTSCYEEEDRRSVFRIAAVLSINDCWYR